MRVFHGDKRQWLARLAFSRDGRYLAASADPASPGQRLLQAWDTAGDATPVWSWEDEYGALFAFIPDGRLLSSAYDYCHWFDLRTGEFKEEDSNPNGFYTVALAPDGRFILGMEVRAERTLRLWTFTWRPDGWEKGWEKELPIDPQVNGLHGYAKLLFSSDSARLVRVYSRERSMANAFRHGVQVFAADTGELVTEWVGVLPYSSGIGAGPGAGAVVVLRDRSFFALDTAAPDRPALKRRNANPKHFTDLAFSPDGRWLATTSNDTAATVWDTATWEVQRRYEWKIGRLRSVCFAPDGLRCAAGSDTGQVVVWDLDE